MYMPKITRIDLNKKSGPKAMITKPERELPKGSKSLMLDPFLLRQ